MGELPALSALDRVDPGALQQVVLIASADHLVAHPSCRSGVGREVRGVVGVMVAHAHPVVSAGAKEAHYRRVSIISTPQSRATGISTTPVRLDLSVTAGIEETLIGGRQQEGSRLRRRWPGVSFNPPHSLRRRGAPSMRLCCLRTAPGLRSARARFWPRRASCLWAICSAAWPNTTRTPVPRERGPTVA